MVMGDLSDLLSKMVNLDKRLRAVERLMIDLKDRVDVIETNSITFENRLQDLEEDDDK